AHEDQELPVLHPERDAPDRLHAAREGLLDVVDRDGRHGHLDIRNCFPNSRWRFTRSEASSPLPRITASAIPACSPTAVASRPSARLMTRRITRWSLSRRWTRTRVISRLSRNSQKSRWKSVSSRVRVRESPPWAQFFCSFRLARSRSTCG